jgi:hypothetical protein
VPPKTFNAKELKEKAEEVRVCRDVAREMNRSDGTDYYAKDPVYYLENPDEPTDVELFSESGTHPPYPIQVVTTPSNKYLELRTRIDSIETFENRLASALAERGQHYMVRISLGKEGLHKIPQNAVTQCANLMAQNKLKEGDWSLEWTEIAKFSPTLHKLVRRISVYPAPRLTVRVNRTAWTPSDERLIEESIRLKDHDKRYAPAVKAKTALVIDASAFIDYEQVQSYIASGKAAAITFSEVWIVLDNRAVCLKQR